MAYNSRIMDFLDKMGIRMSDGGRRCANCLHYDAAEHVCRNPRCRLGTDMTGAMADFIPYTSASDVCDFYEMKPKYAEGE